MGAFCVRFALILLPELAVAAFIWVKSQTVSLNYGKGYLTSLVNVMIKIWLGKLISSNSTDAPHPHTESLLSNPSSS